MRIFVFLRIRMRAPGPRPLSWIGKAGSGMFSVDALFDGEWEDLTI